MSDRRDRGAADALGLVLVAPASIGLALLVIGLGRRVDSTAQARSAAESAAQAAALERDPEAAASVARRVVEEALVDHDSCGQPVVDVDLTEFRPGGRVWVTVECHASDRAIEIVQPAAVSYSAVAVATVDPFRAGQAP